MEKMEWFKKTNGKYEDTPSWVNLDRAEIYDRLAHELIAKNINKCQYIKRITRTNLYNGFIKIVVVEEYGKIVFTIHD